MARPSWLLLITGIFLLALVVILRFLQKQAVIARAFSQSGHQLLALYKAAVETMWLVVCYGYMAWWGIKLPVRRALTATAAGVLTGGSLVFLADGVAVLFHHEILSDQFPLWTKVLIVLLAFLMLRHRWHEWKRQKQKSHLTYGLRLLFREIAALHFISGSDDVNQARLGDFITKVLMAFRHIFSETALLNLNVLLPREEDGRLTMIYLFPPEAKEQYATDFSLAPREGGAGTAFATGRLVYIPAVRYRHGISISLAGSSSGDGKITTQTGYELADLVYMPTEKEPYRCILSVPIMTDSGAVGVLNLDSERQNAFGEFDFDIADLAASAIAMVLDRYRAVA